MSVRWGELIVLIVFLLTVPAGVFLYFTGPMGYPKSTAGIIAGVLALVGLALAPVAIRRKPSKSAAPDAVPTGDAVGTTVSLAVFIGFLVVMVGILVYFALREG